MFPVDTEQRGWIPTTEEEKEKIRQQMNRLLETSHFKNSRRYPMLFRFIVEETLEGRGKFLKERLLGVRVFDRPADYDTAADPIVRVTIAEIRKRIAQYYHEEAHDSELRIELLPGHYVPEFRPSKESGYDHQQLAERSSLVEDEPLVESLSVEPHARPAAISSAGSFRFTGLSRTVRVSLVSILAVLILLSAGLLWQWAHPSALDQLWQPLLANRQTVIFCLPVGVNSGQAIAMAAGVLVPDNGSTSDHSKAPATSIPQPPPNATFLAHEILGENLVFSDALAMLHISNYLAKHNRESTFRSNNITTLNDLRQGPVVLVGGLDNQWTLRALAPLRYRFAGNYEEQYWITDSNEPGKREWGLDLKVPLSDVQRDYAIIARVHDEATGQVEMIVAGIGMSGTAAAGEFLVDPVQIEELRRRVGPAFRDRDFEAVLSTDVVNGMAGPPRILTVAIR